MKILHFLVTNELSGAENVVMDILNGLKSDNEVYYVSPEGPIRSAVEENGINYIPCNTESISEIRRVYKEIKPDIVHACDPRMSFKCALSGIPFIAHLHSNCGWMKKICPNSAALLFTAMRSKAVIAVSDSIAKEYVFNKAIKKKLFVLENTVGREKVMKASREPFDGKFDLIYVGRLSKEKEPIKFLETVKKVSAVLSGVSAAVVGDGEMRGEAERYIKQNALDNVTLFGFDRNPYKYIANSKINIVPSSVEGFGLVAVESMVLSKPVIAFPVGGLSTVVTDECGALCADTDGMASEAVRLLTDEKYYEEKSEGAIRNSYRFTDFEKYIGRIKEIYAAAAK